MNGATTSESDRTNENDEFDADDDDDDCVHEKKSAQLTGSGMRRPMASDGLLATMASSLVFGDTRKRNATDDYSLQMKQLLSMRTQIYLFDFDVAWIEFTFTIDIFAVFITH